MKKIFLLIFSLAFLAACEPKIDEFAASPGNADFTKLVVVGNSMTSGYSNGALYTSGQEASVANILYKQMTYVGSTGFVQPMVTSEQGVLPGKRALGYATDCKGVTTLGVVPAQDGNLEPLGPVGYPVTNLSIPGSKSFHWLAPHYGDFSLLPMGLANPYYCRFSTNPANAPIQEIAPLGGTFFAVWLGDNDALSYALAGGSADSLTPLPLFTYAMNQVLTALTAGGAKGVICTLPDVTSSAFFTTVPWNGLVLTQSQADSVNYAMSLYQLPFVYKAGPNPFLVTEPASPHPYFKVRQMVEGELLLLTVPQDSMKCFGMGIINPTAVPIPQPYPIPDQYVLKAQEVIAIQTAIEGYNQVIRQLADNYGLAVCDMNANMKTLKSGIVWDGIKMNAKFVTGGVFSTDGLHLTPRGSAVAANYIIDAINAKYGSNLPHADVTAYPALIFP